MFDKKKKITVHILTFAKGNPSVTSTGTTQRDPNFNPDLVRAMAAA